MRLIEFKIFPFHTLVQKLSPIKILCENLINNTKHQNSISIFGSICRNKIIINVKTINQIQLVRI